MVNDINVVNPETNLLSKFAGDITLSIPIGPNLSEDSSALVKYESYEIKGPFTWKEDDPSAGIILALGSSERGMFSAFSLHVKGCIWPQC